MKAIFLPLLPSTMHRDSRVKYCGRKAGAESNMISLARSLARSHAGDFQAEKSFFVEHPSVRVRPRPPFHRPPSVGRIFSLTQLCNQQTTLRRESYACPGRKSRVNIAIKLHAKRTQEDGKNHISYRHGDDREATVPSLSVARPATTDRIPPIFLSTRDGRTPDATENVAVAVTRRRRR